MSFRIVWRIWKIKISFEVSKRVPGRQLLQNCQPSGLYFEKTGLLATLARVASHPNKY